MPFVLVFIGLIMIVTGANNTYPQFAAQLKADFTGTKSFIPYALALGAVGALGYIDAFRRFSHYFMALILIALVLSNKGFFQNFVKGINATPVAPQSASSTASNPSGQGYVFNSPLLDLGPLGTINPSLTPGSTASNIFNLFGGTTK